MVELLRDVVGEFQVLALVLADRHAGRVIGQDVGRHQVRIDVQPGRGVLPVLARLVLELRHAVQPADARDAVEDPGKLRVCADTRLHEQDVLARVDAAGEQHRRHLAGLLRELLRVLPFGDRMQVDHAVDAVVAVLQRHPVAHGAEVVAEMGDAGRLDAGEDALHGGLIADWGRGRKIKVPHGGHREPR